MPEHDALLAEAKKKSSYDSTIIESTAKKITNETIAAHEAALKMEVKMADLIAVLAAAVPEKAEALQAKLDKYEAGRLTAQALYTVVKMDVGVPALFDAYEQLAPGYERNSVFPAGFQKPVLV